VPARGSDAFPAVTANGGGGNEDEIEKTRTENDAWIPTGVTPEIY
jgi:hypothetical protein